MSMEMMWLPEGDVVQLTGRRRWSAQRAALMRMGIRFIVNAAGRPLVQRSQVEIAPRVTRARAKQEPNWDNMYGTP